MKNILNKQIVFNTTLRFLFLLSKTSLTQKLIPTVTSLLAIINLQINRPKKKSEVLELANSWKDLMPYDGQDYFKISDIENNTAYVEIHLNCPLRGTGKVDTCYKFMNYDRQLMKKIGGSLTVIESQSNSGKNYCKLAIREIADATDDLTPAHLNK